MKILLVISAFFLKFLHAKNLTMYCNSITSSSCFITGKSSYTGTLETQIIPRSVVDVTYFSISSLKLPRLTSSICGTFPNLSNITAVNVSLEVVDEDAFVPCKVIKEIDLSMNNIIDLKPNTFNRNPTLERIRLYHNQIERIDDNLFANLSELISIDLEQNNISHFPAVITRDIKMLSYLTLCYNQILDLETRAMLDNLPKLKIFCFHHNNFECGRYKEIIRILDDKKLIHSTSWDENRMYSYSIYDVLDIEQKQCINKTHWNSLKTKADIRLRQEIKITELYRGMSKNEQDIKNLKSIKDSLSRVEDNVNGLAINTSNLSELLTKVASSNSVLENQVDENRVLVDLRLSYVKSDLADLQRNMSSMKVTIYENHNYLEGLWTTIILLTLILIVQLVFMSIMIRRLYNKTLIALTKNVEMKSILDMDNGGTLTHVQCKT